MAYKATPLALEAKNLLKTYLRIPDGAAQDQVDRLADGDLADIVAAQDYPFNDRREAIVGVLSRVAQAAVPHDEVPVVAEAATDEDLGDTATEDDAPDDDDQPAGE